MKELILIAIGAALVNNVVLSQFLGIDALSGATLTTNAVTNGVNAGICCFNYCSESGLLSGEGGNS